MSAIICCIPVVGISSPAKTDTPTEDISVLTTILESEGSKFGSSCSSISLPFALDGDGLRGLLTFIFLGLGGGGGPFCGISRL